MFSAGWYMVIPISTVKNPESFESMWSFKEPLRPLKKIHKTKHLDLVKRKKKKKEQKIITIAAKFLCWKCL